MKVSVIYYVIIIIVFLAAPFVNAQVKEYSWRWAEDNMGTTQGTFIKYDKVEHFIGGVVLHLVLRYVFRYDNLDAWIGSTVFWFLWEIKDGYTPWEQYGVYGGDGFSYKDFWASAMGASFGLILTINL